MSSVVPRITGVYKIQKNVTKIDLNKASGLFLEVFRYDGLGNLYSLLASFNNEKVLLKLIIDDVDVFEIDGKDIEDYFGKSDNSLKSNSVFQLDKSKDSIMFVPRYPILFRKSVVLHAKANAESSSRDFKAAFVELSEE